LELANRLDALTRRTLTQYATLIHRNGGGGSDASLGALQMFQSGVITQSRLLAYIDIYFGLAVLAGAGLLLLAFCRARRKMDQRHFHSW